MPVSQDFLANLLPIAAAQQGALPGYTGGTLQGYGTFNAGAPGHAPAPPPPPVAAPPPPPAPPPPALAVPPAAVKPPPAAMQVPQQVNPRFGFDPNSVPESAVGMPHMVAARV